MISVALERYAMHNDSRPVAIMRYTLEAENGVPQS